LQASRIVAQLLVAGATTVLRAASQAWHQALQSELQMLGDAARRACQSFMQLFACNLVLEVTGMQQACRRDAVVLHCMLQCVHVHFQLTHEHGHFHAAWRMIEREAVQSHAEACMYCSSRTGWVVHLVLRE
jgi:hypothetical protein